MRNACDFHVILKWVDEAISRIYEVVGFSLVLLFVKP